MATPDRPSKLNVLQCNVYVALALRLGLVALMYTLMRGIFYLYNKDLLGIDSWHQLGRIFYGGLRFDASAIIYTNVLVILLHLLPLTVRHRPKYQRAIGWIYWLSNIPMLVLNLGDVVYYRFTGRRTSLDVLDEFASEDPLGFVHFLWSYWGITLTGITLVTVWVWLYRRIAVVVRPTLRRPWLYYISSLVLSTVCVGLSIGAMRGGFLHATRPISPANASAYVDKAEQRAMVLNTPFTMLRLIGKPELPPYRFMPDEKATKYFDPIYRPEVQPTPYSGKMRGRNVVVIIWESLAREWVGGLNQDIHDYEGYTPFVDSLLSQSYYFTEAYAGGTKSIDAMPNLFSSVPKPDSPFVLSPYSGNRLSSIAQIARDAGYSTAFFHNAPNGSMGFDAMAHQLGFEYYYGKDEFGDNSQFDGSWGIWDEPFLQFVCRTLGSLQEPFLAAEFTTTSHEPYRLPKDYESVFSEGPLPIHRCVRYTDYALRQFFTLARSQPWYANTLFVITADHAVPGVLEQYKNSRGAFRIPMIFFDPQGMLVGSNSEAIVQQADLMPTLIDLLGLERDVVAFGKNMLAPTGANWAVNTISGGYQLIRDNYLLQYDGERLLGVYDYKVDPKLTQNLKNEKLPEVKGHVEFLQAYLQQFSERMRSNSLVVDKD